MWQPNYEPVGGSLGLSALVAAIPVLVLCFMLGVQRKPGWIAALTALGMAFILAIVAYGMPVRFAVMSTIAGGWTLSDRVDRLRLDHAVPPGGRHRQVRDHQGLGRRAFEVNKLWPCTSRGR